ncbi:MAG: helix-turn-helix transcriptional regulator [Clostridia bacterium]|nr:helix-turn-helix transcriptional regulator [Clostridia bacterium]
MVDPIKTGELIAAMRKRYHMTQAELGEKLMVSAQAVSKWESGQALPDAALLPDLAAALYTSADYLLRGGAAETGFARAVSVADTVRAVDCLAEARRLMGKDNTLWQGMAEGVEAKMNTDLDELLSTDFLREAAVAELLIQALEQGAYVDPEEAKALLKHDHWRNMILARCERKGILPGKAE